MSKLTETMSKMLKAGDLKEVTLHTAFEESRK